MKARSIALMALALALFVGAPLAAAQVPLEQVRATVDKVIETLKEKGPRGAARRERLSALIRPRFDFPLMAQWVLGPNWRKASAEEKQRFIALFTDTLEETYVGKIENYTDEQVRYVGEKIEGDKAVVDTLIVTRSAEIPISYKLVRKGQEWLVYDVVIEGVSLVRNFRTTYDEIARKEGLGGLLTKMEEKLREMRSNKQPGGKS
jgi:phospholipid transport system substrate-binding protein